MGKKKSRKPSSAGNTPTKNYSSTNNRKASPSPQKKPLVFNPKLTWHHSLLVSEWGRIYLSIADCQSFGYRPGQVVTFHYYDNKHYGSIWPCDRIPKGSVKVKRGIEVPIEYNASPGKSINNTNAEQRIILNHKCPSIASLEALSSITLIQCPNNHSEAIEPLSDRSQGHLKTMLSNSGRTWYATLNSILSVRVFGIISKWKIIALSSSSNNNNAIAAGSVISEKTRVVLSKPIPSPTANKRSYASVGGLESEVNAIHDLIQMPLHSPQVFKEFGLPPTKGILMHGPPGTGKTLIAKAAAAASNATFYAINGPEVVSRYVGESEATLRSIFTQAQLTAPSLIFIDEIDAICPSRTDRTSGELEKRIVATLLTLMDGVESKTSSNRVVVLAATNRPGALDPALRRPGRLDREIEIGIPNTENRADILRVILSSYTHHTITNDDIAKTAALAKGFVGADLKAMCNEASMHAIDRLGMDTSTSSSPVVLTIEDLEKARVGIQPSALREIAIDVPHVAWSDIGGQGHVKQALKEAVEWPLLYPEAFSRLGIDPPAGILLYGPPGCSKTLTAKALATDSHMNFIAVKGPELLSKWVGESEKAIQTVFRRARAAAPTLVFFDEIDAIATARGSNSDTNVSDRVLTQLLQELDGVAARGRVLVIAATNRPDLIDKALLRPGRMDRLIYVGPPDNAARKEILKIHTSSMPLDTDVNLHDLSGILTERYSGAELAAICREAALCGMEEDPEIKAVSMRHFETALEMIKPQIDDEMLLFFETFRSGNRRN